MTTRREPGTGVERPALPAGATSLEGADRLPAGARIAVVVSRYNDAVTHRLLAGAVATLSAAGLAPDRLTVAWVPGAFELPLAADRLAATGRFAAVICLGAIIRGETTHDRHIASAVAHGIEEASRARGVPILFGVLTCNDLDQAFARAGAPGGVGNKGSETAAAAVAMVALLGRINGGEA